MIFKKNCNETTIKCVFSNIFDPQDFEVIVLRGNDCEVVFTNKKAAARMNPGDKSAHRCTGSFSKIFPRLCNHCPCGGKNVGTNPEPFEIQDVDKRTYIVRRSTINWIDGKPVSVFILRDISPEKETNERLYALAYIDQLTHVPNRQKLNEDFHALEEKIAENRLSGVVAIFDLDNFKTVNDTYGHNTGDVILRRLTDHLQENKAFSGHLYRLGGDEFVFLFAEPSDKFDSESDMKNYYNDLLSNALHAYTLPNIEVECTLSIGVSFFPKHGDNLSETLRKAYVALYNAKTSGRNQIAFFEDQYDAAQKFKDLYVTIQPVLLKAGKTFGYELIDHRSNAKAKEEENIVSLNEFNHTLDALGLNDIENRAHYFISYSKQLFNPAVLGYLPKEKFIIQVPIPAKFTKTDLATCDELQKYGYKLALTGLHSDSSATELLRHVNYCKFSPADTNLVMQKKVIEANPKLKFIATNVDSADDFQAAKDAGFHLFQGFFFNQPVIGKKTKEISPLKVNYLRLLKLSSTDEFMNFNELNSIISSDVALSYKLLHILNSTAVGLRYTVSSISGALAYIGEESLKKWIAVLALRGIAEGKPLEIIRISLIRARFGELLAPYFRIKRNPQKVFMVSMLSLLHIALEKSKEQLLEEIQVTEDIHVSLLTKNGIYSDLLRFYENYEYANWDLVSQFVEEHRMNPTVVNDAYIAATKWYNDLVGVI